MDKENTQPSDELSELLGEKVAEKKTEFPEQAPFEEPVQAPTTVEEPKEEKTAERIAVMSGIDSHVHDRMKGQPRSLKEVVERVQDRVSPGEHFLSLPKELKAYEKDFAFRWIAKDKKKIDRALDVQGWVFVSRVQFPSLPKHLFTTNGSVERGDMILAFMTRNQVEAMRRANYTKAQERVKELPMDKWKYGDPEVYYKPTLSPKEDSDTTAPGLVEGRDFGTTNETQT